jgi:peptide chain release factor 2
MLAEESDADLATELADGVSALEADVEKLELAALLSGEHDAADAVATVNAGAGGTESQDWAEMLLRMYLRWAEREGMSAEVDEIHHGEEAGIKSATLTLKGTHAYGLLSAERGVHRLVRISPFDSQKRRHTSFASLDVIPLLEEAEEEDLEIPPVQRPRWAVGEHDRLGGADHAPADGHRGRLPERAQPAPEQGGGDAHPEVASRGARTAPA